MVNTGIYCAKNKTEVLEKHGGVDVKTSFYHHLCFYIPEKLVGFYGGSKNWTTPYETRNFRYHGKIIRIESSRIEFVIKDPYHDDEWIFEGRAVDGSAWFKAVRKSDPEKVWLEDEFEYMGNSKTQ